LFALPMIDSAWQSKGFSGQFSVIISESQTESFNE